VKSNLAQRGKPILFSLKNDTLMNWKYAEGVEDVEQNMVQLCEQALKQLVGVNGIGRGIRAKVDFAVYQNL